MPAARWIILFGALALAGCGVETVAVDDDPLTKKLGESGVTVQHVSEEMSPEKLQEASKSGDLTEVERANDLLERLLNYQPAKVDMDELDAAIDNPNAPYGRALRTIGKWRRHARQLADAAVPASSFASSPDEVQAFVGHWNEYVGAWRKQAQGLADLLAQGVALRDPTTRFFKRVRIAIRSTDSDAYRIAVDRYVVELKAASGSIFDKDGFQRVLSDAGSTEAFDAVVKGANESEDVKRLVETLRIDYPGSVFAERLTR